MLFKFDEDRCANKRKESNLGIASQRTQHKKITTMDSQANTNLQVAILSYVV